MSEGRPSSQPDPVAQALQSPPSSGSPSRQDEFQRLPGLHQYDDEALRLLAAVAVDDRTKQQLLRLSSSEIKYFALLVGGFGTRSRKEIATDMGRVQVTTVDKMQERIMEKLDIPPGANNRRQRAALVMWAALNGCIRLVVPQDQTARR